jgi:hypothetical protein
MANQTKKLLRDMNGRFNPPKLTPIATEMYLPNHSGTHDAGILNKTPTKDNDLVNKKYVDDAVSNFELELTRKTSGNSYMEFTQVGDDVTQVNFWTSSGKTLKLFTKDITYYSGNPTLVVITDEQTSKVLTITIGYSGDNVTNVTKVVS